MLETLILSGAILGRHEVGYLDFILISAFLTSLITTMEQQTARLQQRNGLGIALVGRLAHILLGYIVYSKYITVTIYYVIKI